jgi:hypothetical protein
MTDQQTDITTNSIIDVQTQIARADTKASILFGLSLAGLTGGAALSITAHLHGLAVAAAVSTACLIAAALSLLGAAVRPALGGNHGFVRWASASTVEDLYDELRESSPIQDRLEHLWMLARAAQRKYRRVRLAVDLLGAALASAAVTAILSGLGW